MVFCSGVRSCFFLFLAWVFFAQRRVFLWEGGGKHKHCVKCVRVKGEGEKTRHIQHNAEQRERRQRNERVKQRGANANNISNTRFTSFWVRAIRRLSYCCVCLPTVSVSHVCQLRICDLSRSRFAAERGVLCFPF